MHEPRADSADGGGYREDRLHYRCPPVTRTENGCRELCSAVHSGRMLHEIDVNCGATEKCCCESSDELKNQHRLFDFKSIPCKNGEPHRPILAAPAYLRSLTEALRNVRILKVVPTVMRFDGLRVVVYSNDHRPAHIHVIGRGCEAVFNLNCSAGPAEVRENYGFPKR